MSQNVVIITGLLILSTISGMLGLGVAFSAVPFLGLFLSDLVHQVQPLSLLLNGLTALFSTFGFAKGGHIEWRRAIILSVVTTLAAPIGSYLVRFVPQLYIWFIYFAAVAYLAYRLFKPVTARPGNENFNLALILAIPISVLAGFLGIGPGFLLMPTLIIVGFDPKKAAGINAWAVTPPSFSALIPRLSTIQFDLNLLIPLLIVGAVGSYVGARITSRFVPSVRIKQIFGVLIVLMTLYKIYTMIK